VTAQRFGFAFAALALALGACSGKQGDQAAQGASQAVQSAGKAAQSIATSAPVLAARDVLLGIEVRARIVAVDIDAATSVTVSARDGVVALGGTVRTAALARAVDDAARKASGVRVVRSTVRVDPNAAGAGAQARNLALAASVMATVAAQTGINAIGVRAQAQNGAVTIDGTVHSTAMKQIVLDAARHTSGVHSVADRLQVSR
jgi:hyperosmotically inducible protein